MSTTTDRKTVGDPSGFLDDMHRSIREAIGRLQVDEPGSCDAVLRPWGGDAEACADHLAELVRCELFLEQKGRDRDRDDRRFSDFSMPGSKVRLEVEAAYGRGYQQGACTALHALERGAPLTRLKHWATIRLHAWRYRWNRPGWTADKPIKVVAPPEPSWPEGKERS
jgi:hypothetical protein